MNEVEALQERVKEKAGEKYGPLYIEWEPKMGFWLIGEPRWIGDVGDYLGEYYWEAKRSLDYILGYKPELVPTSLEEDIERGRIAPNTEDES